MSKVYAVQVAPECQGYGFCDSIEAIAESFAFEDDFIIEGDEFVGYISSDNEAIIDIFTDEWMDYEDRIENIEQYVNRIFSDDEVEVFEKMFDDFEDDVPTILTAVTGKEWESGAIRGCCQGDYAEIYYVKDMFSRDTINAIEAYYFNTGSEWIVYEPENEIKDVSELDDESGFSIYCTEWNDDGIREEIAGSCYNVNPSDVVLLAFDGYTQTPKYEMRFAKEDSVSENAPVAA